MRPLSPSDPKRVGRYRTLSRLGTGGMGRVFLSSGPDGRLVALKLVSEEWLEVEGFRDRFRGEVDASRRVSGAYTAPVIDADTESDEPWLASEYVAGVTVDEAIRNAGQLPEAAALRLTAGLASALTVIHRVGLVHRDLKPTNILLADDGPRVIDFGIARATDNPGGAGLTRTGRVIGTAGYMSPEQAEGKSVTPASDVFCLGAVVAMACTGSGPFDGPSDPQTLYNIVHTEPDLSALPPRVRRIVGRCLAKNPADRPSPEQLLSSIGDLVPTGRPWPPRVHQLIDQRRAEVTALCAKPSLSDSVAGLVDATRQLTRGLTRVDPKRAGARDSPLARAREAGARQVASLVGRAGTSDRNRKQLTIVRDVLIVVIGILVGLFVFADLNVGDPIDSDRASLGIGDSELDRALTHAGYFGIVIGFLVGGVIGALARCIIGKRAGLFGRVAVGVSSAGGFLLGWLAEHDQLDISIVSLGLAGESDTIEDKAGLITFGIAASIGMLVCAIWVVGKVGIVLAIIGAFPSVLVGAAWANLSATGIIVDGSTSIGLASVVGGTIGGAIAYRIIAAVRDRNSKPKARQW